MRHTLSNDMQRLYDLFASRVGAHSDLELKLQSVEQGVVNLELPFTQRHATARQGGRLSSGGMFAAVDSACGFAVMLSLSQPQAIATVNLRVDHICHPASECGVVIEARSFKTTDQFAYLQARILSIDRDVVYSNAIGIFKIGSPGPDFSSALI